MWSVFHWRERSSECAIARKRAAGQSQIPQPLRRPPLCISGSRDVKDSSGGPQSARRRRRPASRVSSFIELQPQTVKHTFDAEGIGGATRKRRCQPADADVVVRGSSISTEDEAVRKRT